MSDGLIGRTHRRSAVVWARKAAVARFPSDDEEIAPTRLGNAIRALETYGPTRFELDSQVLWSELCAVVPKYLQTELDRSRATVDFFVALIFLSALFGAVTIGVAFDGKIKPLLVLIGLLAFLSIRRQQQEARLRHPYCALPYLKVLFRAQRKLYHAFEQLVCGKTCEIVHDQLFSVEPHEIAKFQRPVA